MGSHTNLKEYFGWMITLSTKLAMVWDSNEVPVKEKVQKLMLPEGVSYNYKNGVFLTTKVNEVFAAIPQLNCISEDDNNEQGSITAALSNLVGAAGFELYLADLLEIQKLKCILHTPEKQTPLYVASRNF
jgi:hypothetical protein